MAVGWCTSSSGAAVDRFQTDTTQTPPDILQQEHFIPILKKCALFLYIRIQLEKKETKDSQKKTYHCSCLGSGDYDSKYCWDYESACCFVASLLHGGWFVDDPFRSVPELVVLFFLFLFPFQFF